MAVSILKQSSIEGAEEAIVSSENLMVIDLPGELLPESQKSLREQVYYLSSEIEQVSVTGTELTVRLSGARGEQDALRKRIADLAAAAAVSFRRVRTSTLFELEGTGTCS